MKSDRTREPYSTQVGNNAISNIVELPSFDSIFADFIRPARYTYEFVKPRSDNAIHQKQIAMTFGAK